MDFANEVKQSFMAFYKAYNSPFIWHSGYFREIASSLRSSQNPFLSYKIPPSLHYGGQSLLKLRSWTTDSDRFYFI